MRNKINIQLFSIDKGFFEKAFEEEITPVIEEQPETTTEQVEESIETPSEAVEEPTMVDEPEEVQTQAEEVEVPSKINIEGIGELDIDEIKQGYLRQSDYTQKTQQLAEERKAMGEIQEFYDFFAMNPHLMERLDRVIKEENLEVNQVEKEDPNLARIQELEQRIALTELKAKYPDVNEQAIMSKATELGVKDLEFVYKALKADTVTEQPVQQVNVEEIKEQLMKELLPSLKAKALEEAQRELSSTQSIVTGGHDAPPSVSEPVQLHPDEVKVARMMGMTNDEYYKYKQLGQ